VRDEKLHEDIGAIKADMRNLLLGQARIEAAFTGHVAADEERFATLEDSHARARGAMWAIGGIMAGVTAVIGWFGSGR